MTPHLSSQKEDYLHALKTFRSLGDGKFFENTHAGSIENSKKGTVTAEIEQAKENRTIRKDKILEHSHLELSGLEDEQIYSAAMVAGFDKINTVNLRRDWSEYIKYGFFFMVGVQVLIIPALFMLMFFRPDITFDKITPIIYVVIGENFLQIIGLVLVVVKFLFPQELPHKKE